MQNRGAIRVVRWESAVATLSSFPVIVFAYTCHQNVRYSRCYLAFEAHSDKRIADVLYTQRDWKQLTLPDHQRCHS